MRRPGDGWRTRRPWLSAPCPPPAVGDARSARALFTRRCKLLLPTPPESKRPLCHAAGEPTTTVERDCSSGARSREKAIYSRRYWVGSATMPLKSGASASFSALQRRALAKPWMPAHTGLAPRCASVSWLQKAFPDYSNTARKRTKKWTISENILIRLSSSACSAWECTFLLLHGRVRRGGWGERPPSAGLFLLVLASLN
jgi:hypothetical protein